jgi:alanine-alpha-ketoisovalerate/valine-pyruvate aminotransferase
VISGHHFFPGLDRAWRHRDECVRINFAQEPEMVRDGIRLIADEVARAYDTRGTRPAADFGVSAVNCIPGPGSGT